jgi:predicted TIM-barrel enzyme
MAFITREEALKRLRAQGAAGKPIVGCGAGHRHLGQVRRGGRRRPDHHLQLRPLPDGGPRLAGRAAALRRRQRIVVEMAAEVLPVVKDTPVLAGVNGTDPFRLMPVFLKQLKEMGFTGVQNFPTVGLIDGTFRANLEATGMGYDKEIEMIALAHELDLLTTPYVFDTDQAAAMAQAGADSWWRTSG